MSEIDIVTEMSMLWQILCPSFGIPNWKLKLTKKLYIQGDEINNILHFTLQVIGLNHKSRKPPKQCPWESPRTQKNSMLHLFTGDDGAYENTGLLNMRPGKIFLLYHATYVYLQLKVNEDI